MYGTGMYGMLWLSSVGSGVTTIRMTSHQSGTRATERLTPANATLVIPKSRGGGGPAVTSFGDRESDMSGDRRRPCKNLDKKAKPSYRAKFR